MQLKSGLAVLAVEFSDWRSLLILILIFLLILIFIVRFKIKAKIKTKANAVWLARPWSRSVWSACSLLPLSKVQCHSNPLWPSTAAASCTHSIRFATQDALSNWHFPEVWRLNFGVFLTVQ